MPSSTVISPLGTPHLPAAAATSIATKLGLPQRLSTLMRSEGMFNDATALVLYGAAVTAATTGQFSAGRAIVSLGYASLAGAAIGLAVAFIVDFAFRTIEKTMQTPPRGQLARAAKNRRKRRVQELALRFEEPVRP